MAAAGLAVLALQLAAPAPDPARPRAPRPALEVFDFRISVTRTSPTGSTRLLNDNGRLARETSWNPVADPLAELSPAVHSLATRTFHESDLR